MVQLNFDATQYEPRSRIGEGWHEAVVQHSEGPVQSQRNPANSFLAVHFQIVDGQSKGKNIVSRFNLWNTSEDAVRIAHEELSGLAQSMGMTALGASEDLHGHGVMIRVGAQRNDPEMMEIKEYAPVSRRAELQARGAAQATPVPPPHTAQPAPPAAPPAAPSAPPSPEPGIGQIPTATGPQTRKPWE